MAEPEVVQLDTAPAEVEGGRLRENVGRGRELDLTEGIRLRGVVLDEPRTGRLAGGRDEINAAHVAPDRHGGETGVAEGVVPVAVRVHDRDDVARQGAQVVAQLVGEAMIRAR